MNNIYTVYLTGAAFSKRTAAHNNNALHLYQSICDHLLECSAQWLVWSPAALHISDHNKMRLEAELHELSPDTLCVVCPGDRFIFRKECFTLSDTGHVRSLPSAFWLGCELHARCSSLDRVTRLSEALQPMFLSAKQQHRNYVLATPPTVSNCNDRSSCHPILSVIRRSTTPPVPSHSLNSLDHTPLITIMLSVFNMGKTVEWAIRSVLAQTYPNWELLIGNDASTDNTAELINHYTMDSRIRVIHSNTNEGKAVMMNHLLEHANGTYVLELDGDDWLATNALEALLTVISLHPDSGLVTGGCGVWRRSKHGDLYYRGTDYFDGKLESASHAHPPVPRMYSMKALQYVGGWTVLPGLYGRIFEDIALCQKILKHDAYVQTDETVYHRVIYPRSISQQHLPLYPLWKEHLEKEVK
ncbi:glycosyltransferase family A protein [Paenibacillus sp. FSL H7-0326]|uniref:glycosyltransferase family 2 protein n=1 Tax=Paenibacillus sp. FSL H7-0326 TaxID=1921144 RepID=UPI0009F9A9BF|nr:glycosyltransferase family A protein [Paenibacillus sp. FSL H7-0326]